MTTQLRSRENLEKVLDLLCTDPSPTHAARAIGGSNKLVFMWLQQSAASEADGTPAAESPFCVAWPDPEGPPTFFHLAFLQASKIFIALASCEHVAMIGPNAGHKRVARDGSGKITFKIDLKVASDALRMDDWDWEMEYGTRDRKDIFARDESGCLIPDTFIEPLPAQLRIHLLRSLLPSQFNVPDKSTTEVHHTGGVLVIGERKPEKPRSALEEDLRERLARIREGVKKPNAPVTIMGRGEDGPKEHVNNAAGDDASRPLNEHPRAYTVPALPPPKPQEPSDFRRPTKALSGEDRRAPMPSGGVSLTTGRHT